MLPLLLSALALAAPPDLGETLRVELSAREGPSCQEVAEGRDPRAVRETLLDLADPAVLPPGVPVRAANCALELHPRDPVVLQAAGRWMADPDTPGLALVVVRSLDRLPPERAGALERAARQRAAREPRFALHTGL